MFRYLLLVAGVAVVLFNHANLYHWFFGDELIHSYVARRVAQGASLYGEIPSARPPLSIWPLALLHAVGVAPLFAARSIVALVIFGTAAALFFGVRKTYGEWAATWSAFLFLTAPDLAVRTTFTAIQLVGLGITVSAMFAAHRKPLAAGIAAGAALGAGQHSAIVIFLLGLWVMLRDGREIGRFIAGAGATILTVFGGAYLAGGHDLYTDLVGKHVYHVTSHDETQVTDLAFWMLLAFLEQIVAWCAAGAALVWKFPARNRVSTWLTRPAFVWAACAAVHLLVVGGMRGGQSLYIYPAYPLICAAAGPMLIEGFRASRRGLAFVSAVLALHAIGWGATWHLTRKHDRLEYSAVPYLRIRQMALGSALVVAPRLARYVRDHSRPTDTVFGEPTLAAAIGLMANRRVAGELADLAPRWFALGTLSRRDVIRRLENDHIRYFVTPPWFFMQDPTFVNYLEGCYLPPKVFTREAPGRLGFGIPDVYLFEHRPGECELAPE